VDIHPVRLITKKIFVPVLIKYFVGVSMWKLKVSSAISIIILTLVLTHAVASQFAVAIAFDSQNETEAIRLLNYVEVAVVEKDKPVQLDWSVVGSIGSGKVVLMNVTSVNSILWSNDTCTYCSSCSADGSVLETSSVVKITEGNEELHFVGIVYNVSNKNYTVYLLKYVAEYKDYKATILTRIFTHPEDPNSYVLFQTIANIEPEDKDYVLPVGDVIVILNKTYLSEHYRILAKTLKKLSSIEKETKDIWKPLAENLERLAKIVKNYLNEYDKEAYSNALVFDGPWRWLCVLICNVACAIGCGAGTAVICAAACAGPCAGCIFIWACPTCIACAALCGAIAGAVCWVIGQYGCAPGCDWICEKAGW